MKNNDILLLGAAAVGIYFLSKNKTTNNSTNAGNNWLPNASPPNTNTNNSGTGVWQGATKGQPAAGMGGAFTGLAEDFGIDNADANNIGSIATLAMGFL